MGTRSAPSSRRGMREKHISTHTNILLVLLFSFFFWTSSTFGQSTKMTIIIPFISHQHQVKLLKVTAEEPSLWTLRGLAELLEALQVRLKGDDHT